MAGFTYWALQERSWYYGISLTKCRFCPRWWASSDDTGRCINHVCDSKHFDHFHPWTEKPQSYLSTEGGEK